MPRIARRLRLACGSARSRTRRARRRAAPGPRRRRAAAGERRACPALTRDECVDHRVVLLREHGAGGIQQFTIRAKHLPKRIEDRALPRSEGRDIVGPAQPLDVRMAPRDARGRAGNVRQNAVERHAIPPVAGRACNRHSSRARETEARQIALQPRAAHGVGIERRKLDLRAIRGYEPLLPPGAAHASRTRWPSATSRQCAARCAPASCTETSPPSNPGNRSTGTGRSRRSASSPSVREAIPAASSRSWYSATPVRRRLTRRHIGGWELPAASTASASAGYAARRISIHQRGMLVARLGVGLDARLERAALAQEAAQHRIDVSLGAPALEQPAGAHRLVDHRVLGIAAGFQGVKRAPEQRLNESHHRSRGARVAARSLARGRSDAACRA